MLAPHPSNEDGSIVSCVREREDRCKIDCLWLNPDGVYIRCLHVYSTRVFICVRWPQRKKPRWPAGRKKKNNNSFVFVNINDFLLQNFFICITNSKAAEFWWWSLSRFLICICLREKRKTTERSFMQIRLKCVCHSFGNFFSLKSFKARIEH